MNLRDFVSNDQELMQVMDGKDRSAARCPKILEIQWDSQDDSFQASCSITENSYVSKRTVARAVVSIYDPLRWLIPLTHNAKRFLQPLWKEGYDWVSMLSEIHKEEWYRIITDITGSEKTIPRVVGVSSGNHLVATFADASSESMAACIYLCNSQSSQLLMARERLPSLRQAMRVPKMELNAVTMAFRLTEAVIRELRSMIRIERIYVFSDSEIVLKWLKNQTADRSVMVTNRLNEIRRIVEHLKSLKPDVYFNDVNSAQNPADCATRGLKKGEIWCSPMVEWTFVLKRARVQLDEKRREVPVGVNK
ncbi:hypothetical protein V3C99_017975 [Haemonchus contortus]|uniref:RNase H domain-containing protein n=1 Tax=Haemonchus contortus TaxID=6289 RepID=A0A7I4Z6E5_HAECO